MSEKITTSKNVPTGKKIELTKEQKEKQKERDKKILISYNVQIDQLELEITKLKRALELNLPKREVEEQLETYKKELQRFVAYKRVMESRNKK